MRVKTL